jgi:hypothetical protein
MRVMASSGGRHRARAAAVDPYPQGGDVLQPSRHRHTPSGGGGSRHSQGYALNGGGEVPGGTMAV